MKQDIAIYKVDSFIDFTGNERKFVACALSESPANGDMDLMVGWINFNNRLLTDEPLCHNIYRIVTIGIAVCNPEDTFNEDKGKSIARNKAANIEGLPRIYVDSKGIITQELVETFLNQQIQFFKEHPETVIVGYDEAKKKYEDSEKLASEIASLNSDEKHIFDLAVGGFNFTKYINLAKKYTKKLLKNEQ